MSFVKLKNKFEPVPFTPVSGFESFAGKYGLGVQHNNVWIPDAEREKIMSVIPERFRHDFQLTRMAINTLLLPHVDNDFLCTINFYFQPNNYRTIFFEAREGAKCWKTEEKQSQDLGEIVETTMTPEEIKNSVKEFVEDRRNMPTIEEISYVDAVYGFDDVYETGSFVAEDCDAYLLDITKLHNVEPLGEVKMRKALALRSHNYTYQQVYDMLVETGNL